jgi:hypothetical protein
MELAKKLWYYSILKRKMTDVTQKCKSLFFSEICVFLGCPTNA